MEKRAPASLYIVPTPIGNLEDITLRSIAILKEVDFVIAEDTRVSGKLLHHLGIQKKMLANHSHNEHQKTNEIVQLLKEGQRAALVSDAGTPGISDPGYLLINACIKENIQVECLPGATAFVPALVVSGLPCDRFRFEGFLPQKKGRKTRLENLRNETYTMVFYESPFRLCKALEEFSEVFGAERSVSVSREISKLFEETFRGSLGEALKHFSAKTVKGEIVIVVQGKNDRI